MKLFVGVTLILVLTACSVNDVRTEEEACVLFYNSPISSEPETLNLEEDFPNASSALEQMIVSTEERASKAELAFMGVESAPIEVGLMKSRSEIEVELLKSLKEMIDRYPDAETLNEWADAVKRDNEVSKVKDIMDAWDNSFSSVLDAELAIGEFCFEIYGEKLDLLD